MEKNKKFDSVQMKLDIQEQLWQEAGKSFNGLINLHDKMTENNDLLRYFKLDSKVKKVA